MSYSGNEIAIVGIDLKLPGSNSIEEFWNNLIHSKESICNIPEEEIINKSDLHKHKNYINRISVCEDYDKFDASFFGYSNHEAKSMDPQHRLFLQSCWKAMENSGYVPSELKGNVGVFGSAGYNTYLIEAMKTVPNFIDEQGFYDVLLGNDKDYLATRVSYKLGLKGPSITIQTACSSSLVGVHLASQSLLLGESDLCLVGGACIRVPASEGYLYQPDFILSKDGHCRAFDENSSGTVFGSGVGVVVLKRLEDAARDGDTIYSIIKSSGINNDGNRKIGYTAPSQEGQEEILKSVISLEEIEPQSIAFVEAHGTGTILGDPIELKGLMNSIGLESIDDMETYPCAIGSVKSNIGHMDVAAGIAGLIKASLCIYHKTIVPTLHFKELNKNVNFDNSRFYIANKVKKLSANEYPLRAIVSGFGVGGTNASIILEEPPKKPESKERDTGLHIIKVSAKTKEALSRMMLDVEAVINNEQIAKMAYTLNTGREDFEYRNYLIVQRSKGNNQIIHTSASQNMRTNKSRIYVSRINAENRADWMELYNNLTVFQVNVDRWIRLLKDQFKTSEFSELISSNKINYQIIYMIQIAWLAAVKEITGITDVVEMGPDKLVADYLNGFITEEEMSIHLKNEAILGGLEKASKSQEDQVILENNGIVCEQYSMEEFYRVVGQLWQNGMPIKWEMLFKEDEKEKVPAPTYSFEKKRFWFEDKKQWKSYVWIEDEEVMEQEAEKDKRGDTQKENYLILASNQTDGNTLRQHLQKIEIDAFEVDTSLYQACTNEIETTITELIYRIKGKEASNLKIICTWDCSNDGFDYEEFYKIISFLRSMNKELNLCKNIVFVMLFALDSFGGDGKKSLLMSGITTTVPKELTKIKVKQIELYDGSDSIYRPAVLKEIIANNDCNKVLFKENKRSIITYKNKQAAEKKNTLRERGTYLITGGTGNVGLLFAKEIAKRVNVNIVLLSKNYTEEALNNDSSFKAESIKAVLHEIRQKGITIEIHNCDISDLKELKSVGNKIIGKYGQVNGIIHAAGKVGKAKDYIEQVRLEDVYEFVNAKVEGTYNLEKVFVNTPLDFFIMTSSTVSILGGLGDSIYSGANALLNYMAKLKSDENTPYLSVCFDYLPRIFKDESVDLQDETLKNLFAHQLDENEFSNAFDQILSNISEKIIIIGKTHFDERYRRMLEFLRLPDGVGNEELEKKDLSNGDIRNRVRNIWNLILDADCDLNVNFFDAGGDSFTAIRMVGMLNDTFRINVSVKYIYEFPTIHLIANEIFKSKCEVPIIEEHNRIENSIQVSDNVSVIGMSGRFPGADNIEALWENLLNKKNDILHFEMDEAENVLNAEADGIVNKYVGARGILNHIDKFDYEFFGISKMEAELIDPQQRFFLECVWSALEDAGCINLLDDIKVGVFASQGISTYLTNYLLKHDAIKKDYNNIAVINNSPDSLATRVSYALNLTGISKTVQTFCSSSLVALEEAAASVQSGKCDIAIAGGVNIVVPQQSGYIYNEGSIYSPDGVVRPFDDSANGTIFSNGAGVVVVAKKSWAKERGLQIYSDILGVEVNNDGSQKASFLSPSIKGQAECIAKAYEKAGINPNKLNYIEAHGTATNVGDPIEVYALSKAIERYTKQKEFCALGSIKGNIGHLDRAAGITSFIKGCLVASRRCVPPTANYERANKGIDLKETPFFINQKVIAYEQTKDMYVGISALGVGGTNVHVVLQSDNQESAANHPAKRSKYILTLSARCKESFDDQIKKLAEYFMIHEPAIEHVETTMQIYRKHFPYRKAFAVSSIAEFADELCKLDRNQTIGTEKINTIYFNIDTEYETICKVISALNQESLIMNIKDEIAIMTGESHSHMNDIEALLIQMGEDGLKLIKRSIRKYIENLVGEKIIIIFGDNEMIKKLHLDERSIIVSFVKDKSESEKNHSEEKLHLFKEDVSDFYSVIAKLWGSGIDIDFRKYNDGKKTENIHFPGYSFKKTRCWI